MILRTTVEWTQDKKISPEDLEKLNAKKEVLGDEYNPLEDQDLLYEDTVNNAIIDLYNDKLYVEISKKRICLTHLLASQYVYNTDNYLQIITEKLYIESTLDEIEKELLKSNKKNKKK